MLTNRQIAQIIYTAQSTVDDFDGMPRRWSDALPRDEWDILEESTREMWEGLVQDYIVMPLTPCDQHEKWMKAKRDDGWGYGDMLDPENKQHPCLVEWNDLTPELKAKDVLFCAIIEGLTA